MFLNKKERFIRILFFLLTVGIICVCLFRFFIPISEQNDVLQLNRIENEVITNWDDLPSGNYDSFTYPFAVLDENEELLFTFCSPSTLSRYEAMRQSDIILPIQIDHCLKGTLLIETHTAYNLSNQKTNRQLGILFLSTIAVGFFVLLFYDFYLYRTILKPFSALTDFITRISHGDLDASLQIHGNAAFQSFIQGLDVMREELRAAKQREYEANLSKKSLVASLSHDIKTPVTSIRLAVELLQVQESNPVVQDKLSAIMVKTEQIDHLVTDLFHTTMEDLDELSVHCKDIYSNELSQLIREADLNHCVSTLSIPDCMIHIDPLRMGQVFTNIIYNSYKYAGTELSVSGTIDEECLNLTVQDYGPGIDNEELPCIFNRFYRGKNVGNQTGSGLGLYICKSLIDKMNCEIYCRNNEAGFETLIKIPLV